MKRFLNMTLVCADLTDWVAGTALVLIMLLTSLDVILRYLGYPIPGAYDLVSLGGAFVIGFAIPRTSWDRTHVTVDILTAKLSVSKQAVFAVGTRILALFFFLVLGWNLVRMGIGFMRTGDSTQTLSVPLYPLAFALGICAFIECIVLVADVVRVVSDGGERDE